MTAIVIALPHGIWIVGLVGFILDASTSAVIVTAITVAGGAYATRASARSKRLEVAATAHDEAIRKNTEYFEKQVMLIVHDNEILRAEVSKLDARVDSLQERLNRQADLLSRYRFGIDILLQQLQWASIVPDWEPPEVKDI